MVIVSYLKHDSRYTLSSVEKRNHEEHNTAR